MDSQEDRNQNFDVFAQRLKFKAENKMADKIHIDKMSYQTGWLDAYAESNDKEFLWKEEPIEFLPKYVSYFKDRGVRHVLDVGCGEGRNSLFLLRNAFQVTGIDLSPLATAKALHKVRQHDLVNYVFLNIDIEEYPWVFPSGQFDALVCLDVFGQILKIDNLVDNFHRALKDGGYVLLNLYSPQDDAFGIGERVAEKTFLYKKTLWRFFDREDIVGIFNKFEIISIAPMSWDDPPHPGYRDDPHSHDSFVVLLRKNNDSGN